MIMEELKGRHPFNFSIFFLVSQPLLILCQNKVVIVFVAMSVGAFAALVPLSFFPN